MPSLHCLRPDDILCQSRDTHTQTQAPYPNTHMNSLIELPIPYTLQHFDISLVQRLQRFLSMCILKLSFQSWQYISQTGHSKPPTACPSPLTSRAPITTAERQQQAITARWECDTFHKSLSWEIAFLYPAWDCVWRKNTTAHNTHTTKAELSTHFWKVPPAGSRTKSELMVPSNLEIIRILD